MKKKYQLQKFDSGMHFIMIDQPTVDKLTKNGNKRAKCTLNETESFHCAVLPKKEGGHFINIGLKVCRKLNLNLGDFVSAKFEIDTSKYQFEMPIEFAEVLRTDNDANNIFEKLTDGNKRGLMYLVNQVKSSEKKIERALKIAEKLKNGVRSPKEILK